MRGNYLMVETFNWRIEGNKSGKKETANRGDCTTFKKHVFGSQEKNYCGMKLRSYKRWRDLLEWWGEFNLESECDYYLRSGKALNGK
jgi:hypothetical protein